MISSLIKGIWNLCKLVLKPFEFLFKIIKYIKDDILLNVNIEKSKISINNKLRNTLKLSKRLNNEIG